MDRKGIIQVRDKVDQLNRQHGLNLKVLPPDGGPTRVTSLDVTTPSYILSGKDTEVWHQLDVLVQGVQVGRSRAICELRGVLGEIDNLSSPEEIIGTLREWADQNEVRRCAD